MQPPTLIGTPTDISVEQVGGALGLFDTRNVLARRPPYEAENVWQLIVRAQSCEFTTLNEVAPETPRELVRIARRAMMCARHDCHPNIAAVRQDIVRACAEVITST